MRLIAEIMAELRDRLGGHLNPDHWIADVELGAELAAKHAKTAGELAWRMGVLRA